MCKNIKQIHLSIFILTKLKILVFESLTAMEAEVDINMSRLICVMKQKDSKISEFVCGFEWVYGSARGARGLGDPGESKGIDFVDLGTNLEN